MSIINIINMTRNDDPPNYNDSIKMELPRRLPNYQEYIRDQRSFGIILRDEIIYVNGVDSVFENNIYTDSEYGYQNSIYSSNDIIQFDLVERIKVKWKEVRWKVAFGLLILLLIAFTILLSLSRNFRGDVCHALFKAIPICIFFCITVSLFCLYNTCSRRGKI